MQPARKSTPPRRTQAERSAATRAALVAAARPLFAARGYADVGTPEIAAAAGVTRGALYHQFADKLALFDAVAEAEEAAVMERLAAVVAEQAPGSPLEALRLTVGAFLDVCLDPGPVRILLLEAPAVLGPQRWREIAMQYGLGTTEALLGAAIEAGELPDLPIRAFAHVLLGALDEAGVAIASAEDPAALRAEVEPVLAAILDGLAGATRSPSRGAGPR